MSAAERAGIIRASLKKLGYSSRQVSVVSDVYSMGSAIRISIKDPSVPKSLVEIIAKDHESIDRDQFGEILGGGNRYVTVNYSRAAADSLAAPWVEAVERAEAAIEGNALVPVAGAKGAAVGRSQNGWSLTLWGASGFIGDYSNAAGVAFKIGELLLEGA